MCRPVGQGDGKPRLLIVPTVRANGVDLYFEQVGSGPTLLLAHGGLGSSATALLRVKDFASVGFRAVAYDARGHGQSGFTRTPRDYHKDNRAFDLIGLMDALDLERAHIVGTSMGATTALATAIRWPERVESLILRSLAPCDSNDPALTQLKLLRALYRFVGVATAARIAGLLMRAGRRQRMKAMLSSQRREAVVPMLSGLLEDIGYPGGLENIRHRALLLGCQGDSLHPAAAVDFVLQRLTHATAHMAESRTYWEENPLELRDKIAEFLRDH
jgi:pimeloyl-ACP methyl ester carboxylesterase